MIFKSNRHSFSVYDPTVDKCIAEFIDYKYETNDEQRIARLKELGYEIVEEEQPLVQPDIPEVVPAEEKKTKKVKK
jgi:hypothetical protein